MAYQQEAGSRGAELMADSPDKAWVCTHPDCAEGSLGKKRRLTRLRTFGSERGAVLILSTLMMTLLLGFAGMSVDVGHWYLKIQRAQRAADAAALAGNPSMPAYYMSPDPSGRTARSIAYDTLIRNGVPLADADAAYASVDCSTAYCIAEVPGSTTKLEVKVQTTVQNTFLRFLNIAATSRFVRGATADYTPGLHISSFSNHLGAPEINDGSGLWGPGGAAGNSNYWLQMGGRNTSKVEGDRFNSQRCVQNSGLYYAPDVCSGSVNQEFNALDNGYLFLLELTPSPHASGGWIEVQAYDPQMTIRYSSAVCPTFAAPTCPGDELYGSTNPSNFSNLSFGFYPSRTSQSPWLNCRTFTPRAGPVTPVWEPICTQRIYVDLTQPSTLYFRAYTGQRRGTNHFMLRAGLFANSSGGSMMYAASNASVRMSADQHMPIYNQIDSWAGAGTPNSTFTIGNITSEWAGRTIHFQFWDVGDAFASGIPVDGWLSLGGSPYVLSQLNGNCVYTPPGPTYNPYGFVPALEGGCGFSVTNRAFNGKLVHLNWNVPSSYRCTSPVACRLTVEMDMNGQVADDTTTSVIEPGQPIRIVE